jgi:hypothetical protein
MSDAYRALIEGLRDAVVQPEDGGEATRQRILRDLAAPKRKRKVLVLALVAATLALSTAFALYVAGVRDAERAPQPNPSRPAAAAPLPQVSAGPAAPAAPSVPAAAPAAESSGSITSADQSPARKAVRAPRRSPGPHAVGASASASAAVRPGEAAPSPAAVAPAISATQRQTLYIEAHRLHFRGAPQQALAAWDAYLASQPSGPALLEARFNRAVVLARLGRRHEAEAALAPFARGDHAGLHRAEAEQLLKQLGGAVP